MKVVIFLFHKAFVGKKVLIFIYKQKKPANTNKIEFLTRNTAFIGYKNSMLDAVV